MSGGLVEVRIEEGWEVGSQQILSLPNGQRVAITVPPGVLYHRLEG